MATDTALVLKQYRDLARNIESFSNGQAKLKDRDEDDDSLDVIHVTLAPKTGLYRGGKFDFEMDVSADFPYSPPVVHCMTEIYHPNIDFSDDSGEVCLNLLDDLWTTDMTLEDVVQGLLFLLHHPNLEDPLSCLFTGGEDEEDFQRNVRLSLKGGIDIDGVVFTRNLSASYEDDEEDKDGKSDAVGDREPVEGSGEAEVEPVKQEVPKTQAETVQPATTESGMDFLRRNSSIVNILYKSVMNVAMRIGHGRGRTHIIESSVDPDR